MKARLTFIALLLLFLTGLNAQTGFLGRSEGPLKPQSPLFGKDIVLNAQPIQNQRNLAVCSAFNGWLYAIYSYNNGNQPYVTFLRSTDDGITWDIVMDVSDYFQGYLTTRLDIIACGNSLSTLKIFLAAAVTDTLGYMEWGGIFVGRYQGDPFIAEAQILGDGGNVTSRHYDIALASDQNYPANNSNPFSIAVAYTKSGYGNKDTLKYCSSSNGGMSFDDKRIVALSNRNLEKVALSFGRSPSKPEGRYFVAWEEKNPNNAATGHIYTAHSEPNFDSPFTKAVCLDSLDSSAINKVRNPAIACQVNNADNDSSNLSEIVMLEKYLPGSNRYEVKGFYNLQACSSNYFKELAVSSSSNNKIQPDISFNSYNSTFMMTYFDSTEKKLPFLTNDVNLVNPDSWNIISQAYNDNSNLIAPYPKVKLNIGQQDGMNAWISEGTSGNGIALFDAPYSTYTGISGNNTGSLVRLIGAYPNPCSNEIKIAFELKKTGKVTINVLSILGQPLGTVTDQSYSEGKHVVKYDVSDFPAGTYFYNFRLDDFTASGKFTVIR